MVLKLPKIKIQGQKGIRKVENGHETVKKGPNFAFRSRRKMPKNEPNIYKRTHREVAFFDPLSSIANCILPTKTYKQS